MQLAVGAGAQAGGVGLELAHHQVAEAGELHLADGPQAGQGHADAAADDARLGQRRVDHALRAELVEQALGHAEDAAVDGHVLAQHQHRLVLLPSPACRARLMAWTMLSLAMLGLPRDVGQEVGVLLAGSGRARCRRRGRRARPGPGPWGPRTPARRPRPRALTSASRASSCSSSHQPLPVSQVRGAQQRLLGPGALLVLLAAVLLGVVGGGVHHQAVGDGLDEGGAVAARARGRGPR